MTDKLIAISGGIGSGKSVVSHILKILGYEGYECDQKARALRDGSEEIKAQLVNAFGSAAIVNGKVNRPFLSEIVFGDKARLKELNNIVHAAVKTDLECWCREHSGLKFVETAILYQSGIDKMFDAVWSVEAPEDLRIHRVEKRNGLTKEQVMARIESQRDVAECPHRFTKVIVNDDKTALLPQILVQLEALK